ncbi:hypothetical protein STRTUCAR8_03493 [Streptomyces turgidiscabies Car8]|uniref:Uncharacterized protein n=1 Tax=Streptomyces turgidiscabies (strain Car8) TaxID=698760 RepID=L7FAM1_STRT8|nr:hypothetical protein STRTUCAR8_03493 [Streptomyces turgidiscabies Car8]
MLRCVPCSLFGISVSARNFEQNRNFGVSTRQWRACATIVPTPPTIVGFPWCPGVRTRRVSP